MNLDKLDYLLKAAYFYKVDHRKLVSTFTAVTMKVFLYGMFYLSIYTILHQPIELVICALVVWVIKTPKHFPITEGKCDNLALVMEASFVHDIVRVLAVLVAQRNFMTYLIFEVGMSLIGTLVSMDV